MKTKALQLITIQLENGRRGVFIGGPLVPEQYSAEDCQVSEIWFSDAQEIPGDLDVNQLLELIRTHGCRCNHTIQ